MPIKDINLQYIFLGLSVGRSASRSNFEGMRVGKGDITIGGEAVGVPLRPDLMRIIGELRGLITTGGESVFMLVVIKNSTMQALPSLTRKNYHVSSLLQIINTYKLLDYYEQNLVCFQYQKKKRGVCRLEKGE